MESRFEQFVLVNYPTSENFQRPNDGLLKTEFLNANGWTTWYNKDYWIHPKCVFDTKIQDYVLYGMPLEKAFEFEINGTPPIEPMVSVIDVIKLIKKSEEKEMRKHVHTGKSYELESIRHLKSVARNIVNQILDEASTEVEVRQKINDKCDAFTSEAILGLISNHFQNQQHGKQ